LDWIHGNEKFFFGLGYFSIKDSLEIRFWEDKWIGNATIHEQYPTLYSIVRHKGDTIVKVIESSPPNVTFIKDCLVKDLYLEILYFSVWQISNYNLNMMNSVETCMKMANFQ
jgi:hypothetical protein